MTASRITSMLIILALMLPGVVAFTSQAAHAAPALIAANDQGGGGDKEQEKQKEKEKNPGDGKSALENAKGDNKDPVSQKAVKETSVVEYISDAYNWLAVIGGLLAVLMLIYAGYSYMGSNGDPDRIANAKDVVEKALLGLALLIVATVLLKAVNNRTVEPCTPGREGCGAIDFTQPDGGGKAPK